MRSNSTTKDASIGLSLAWKASARLNGLRSSSRIMVSGPEARAEEVTMYARVTMVTGGSPEQAEQGIADFRNNALPGVKELGARGAMLLIDRQSGEGMAITLWEDEAAMRTSEEQANELRRAAVQALGSTEEPRVERYEVAVFETG
jgi:hypothetical protein